MPNLPGYQQAVGTKREAVHDHKGPKAYTQFSGGGDPLTSASFGISWLEKVVAGVDSTGTYFVVAVKAAGAQASVVLAWYTLAGMTEVVGGVDLSASTVTLWVKGL